MNVVLAKKFHFFFTVFCQKFVVRFAINMEEIHIKKWNEVLKIIKDNIGESLFSDWFSASSCESYENNLVSVRVPSHFIRKVYEDRFCNVIRVAMLKVYGPDVQLQYLIGVVRDDKESDMVVRSPRVSPAVKQVISNSDASSSTIENVRNTGDSQLNRLYNFENYCVGESNRLPYSIAEFIANNPENPDFNPFFLWGDVGVGKTHLIQSIGTRIKERNPGAKVLYVTMRMFQHQQQVASIAHKLPDFLAFYQDMDVLLIDDLQELKSSAPKTMEALFTVFNHLHQRNKKLIFTCDRAPQDLDGITDRLIDRFRWGLTEHLPKPDQALRRMILKSKAEMSGLSLSDDILDMISERVSGSVRELEGILRIILSRSIMLNSAITIPLVRDVLRQHAGKKPAKKIINFEMIVEATADFYNLNPEVLFARNRVRDVADARQVVMYLANKLTGLSSTAIGVKLNRAHTTVLHGIKSVEDHIECEKGLYDAVHSIETTLADNI